MKSIQETQIIANIPMTLIRKKIKHLYITIKPPNGEVIISVPQHMSHAQITQIILAKQDWILRKQNECQKQITQHAIETEKAQYEMGDEILLWGIPYRFDEPVKQPKEWYRAHRIALFQLACKSNENTMGQLQRGSKTNLV